MVISEHFKREYTKKKKKNDKTSILNNQNFSTDSGDIRVSTVLGIPILCAGKGNSLLTKKINYKNNINSTLNKSDDYQKVKKKKKESEKNHTLFK